MKKCSYLILGLCGFIFTLPINGYSETTPTRPKVILIGVDGLTEKVVAKLLSQNRLKNIQYIRDNGSYGRIVSIYPTISPALWTSMATGKNREDHGVIGFQIKDPQTGRLIVTNNSHRKTKAIWNILSEKKMKVGTIGYFNTWPVDAVNGFMISNISISPIERGFYPPEIRKIMREIIAPYTSRDLNHLYPFEVLHFRENSLKYFTPKMFSYLDRLGTELINDYSKIKNKRIYSKTESEQYINFFNHKPLIRKMLRYYFVDQIRFKYAKKMYKNDLDLLALFIKGPDAASHATWEYYEPNLNTPQTDIKAYKDIIPNYYAFVDRVVGYFLQIADPDTTIILVADHGFEKKEALLFDINKVLNTMGYLDYGPDSEIRRDRIFDDTVNRWARHRSFRKLHVYLNNLYPNRDSSQDELRIKQIVDQLSSIRIGNLKLFKKINYYQGKHLAAAITQTHLLYKGVNNISGHYSIEAFINGAFYAPEIINNMGPDNTIIIDQNPYPLKDYAEIVNLGRHATFGGVINFIGPFIKPKYLIEGFSILNITPAILKILDLPIGADMSGGVPIGIFKPEFLVHHPTKYIESYDKINEPSPKGIPQASPIEDQLKQQLRSLGYIQ